MLVLHLKRFGESRKKIQTAVDFPLTEFDVSPLAHAAGSSPTYDLCAVCDHAGRRLNCGHYTAFGVDRSSGSWHKFNDSRVSSVDISSSLLGSGAYMLFYCLRENREVIV